MYVSMYCFLLLHFTVFTEKYCIFSVLKKKIKIVQYFLSFAVNCTVFSVFCCNFLFDPVLLFSLSVLACILLGFTAFSVLAVYYRTLL